MAGVVANLGVGEAKWREPCGQVDLVTQAVAGLLRWSSVVAQPVGLHDQPQIGPEEVGTEAVDVLAGKGNRQAGACGKWQEEPLKFRVGEPKGAPVENLAQARDTPASSISLERSAEGLRVNQIKPIRLVDGPLGPSAIESRGDVDQGGNHGNHGDAVATCHFRRAQGRSAMKANTYTASPRRARDRHFDSSGLR